MPKYLRAYAIRDAAQAGKPGDPIRFVASTENVARDGLIIEAAGWQLDNYRANPVFLWSHDYMGMRPPIGRAEASVSDNALMADVLFDQHDEFALGIERKYRDGFLNTVSVGWDTLAYAPPQSGQPPRITRAELLDISGVVVPGDPDALMERQRRALQTMNTALETLLADDDKPVDASGAEWRGAANRMVSLFLTDAQLTEPARRTKYNNAARGYRKAGKTPPEYRTASEVQVLGPQELAGLFLEGETAEVGIDVLATLMQQDGGARAGAVLNARNRDDLAQAITLVQGVLDRAKKDDAAPEDTTHAAHEQNMRAVLDKLKTIKV